MSELDTILGHIIDIKESVATVAGDVKVVNQRTTGIEMHMQSIDRRTKDEAAAIKADLAIERGRVDGHDSKLNKVWGAVALAIFLIPIILKYILQ